MQSSRDSIAAASAVAIVVGATFASAEDAQNGQRLRRGLSSGALARGSAAPPLRPSASASRTVESSGSQFRSPPASRFIAVSSICFRSGASDLLRAWPQIRSMQDPRAIGVAGLEKRLRQERAPPHLLAPALSRAGQPTGHRSGQRAPPRRSPRDACLWSSNGSERGAERTRRPAASPASQARSASVRRPGAEPGSPGASSLRLESRDPPAYEARFARAFGPRPRPRRPRRRPPSFHRPPSCRAETEAR